MASDRRKVVATPARMGITGVSPFLHNDLWAQPRGRHQRLRESLFAGWWCLFGPGRRLRIVRGRRGCASCQYRGDYVNTRPHDVLTIRYSICKLSDEAKVRSWVHHHAESCLNHTAKRRVLSSQLRCFRKKDGSLRSGWLGIHPPYWRNVSELIFPIRGFVLR